MIIKHGLIWKNVLLEEELVSIRSRLAEAEDRIEKLDRDNQTLSADLIKFVSRFLYYFSAPLFFESSKLRVCDSDYLICLFYSFVFDFVLNGRYFDSVIFFRAETSLQAAHRSWSLDSVKEQLSKLQSESNQKIRKLAAEYAQRESKILSELSSRDLRGPVVPSTLFLALSFLSLFSLL